MPQVLLLLDNTDLVITQQIELTARMAYQAMLAVALPLKSLSPQLATGSIRILPPIYGEDRPVYRDVVVCSFKPQTEW